VLAVVAIIRIVSTYSLTSQAFDEPCHVAAGIELLDRHTYTLDPVHPPLARIAIGLPLYLAGERYPNLPPLDRPITYNDVGNAILYDSGHYLRNLTLARLGLLPFFLLGTAIVFLWARREYGDFAGVMAAAMFTTLPNILAFSSIAYTDIVAASTQVAFLFAFVAWLDKPTRRSVLWLGLAAGLALASKATTLIFFPASAVAILLGKWICTRTVVGENVAPRLLVRHVAIVLALATLIVWATYGFAIQHVREGMNISPDATPSFHYFPPSLARAGRWLVANDPRVPAPALLRGIAEAWSLNQARPAAYLLGHIRKGGWWYFFLIGVAVKSPLPFLILAALGIASLKTFDLHRRWRAMAPALAALAVLLVTMPVKYNAGVRHVIVVFPLLAIVAGAGCSYLWNMRGRFRLPARVGLIALLCWQCISTARASSDFLAFFNELAGRDPSKIMVSGCDLDCGQDLFRLSREFQARHISHATIAMWTSADTTQMHLPTFDVPQPYRPVTGWFAISLRALRFGSLTHKSYPPEAFDWLNAYQPVGRVGKTMLLYYIPEDTKTPPQAQAPDPEKGKAALSRTASPR
jgi:hypothetical protein